MSKPDSRLNSNKTAPDFSLEQKLIGQGYHNIAGVDEAGRGPLAGPVVVGAVILDPSHIPDGLNDSKKLTAARREILFEQIIQSATLSVVSAPPEIIEKLNIRGATLWAMSVALNSLCLCPEFALIDGRDVPDGLKCPGQAVIKGDGRSVSIAAASIIAKVSRDQMCQTMDMEYPDYGFCAHKGYGTAIHMAALSRLGATPHHRADFAPVEAVINRFARSSHRA